MTPSREESPSSSSIVFSETVPVRFEANPFFRKPLERPDIEELLGRLDGGDGYPVPLVDEASSMLKLEVGFVVSSFGSVKTTGIGEALASASFIAAIAAACDTLEEDIDFRRVTR